jgi:hypothetical protein
LRPFSSLGENTPALNEVRIPPSEAAEQEPSEATPRPAAGLPAVRLPREIGGRDGPEPTRYGDWEKDGRCIDF